MDSGYRFWSILLVISTLSLAGCGSSGTSTTTTTTPPPPTPSYRLSVAAPPANAGTITSNPTGINCPTTTCSASFAQNTKVMLTAAPEGSYSFAGWSGGGCTGNSPTCSITVTAATSVTANFNPGYGISIVMAGTGTGNVSSSPAGISCASGATTGCSATFPQNTLITLTETPGTNNTFGGWSGACSGTATTCAVTLSTSNSVTATFSPVVVGSLQNLNHIIIFAQENRSLDHYFGYMLSYWTANGYGTGQTFDGLPQFNAGGTAPLLPGCDPTNPNGPDICTPDPSVTVPSFHMQSVCTEEISPFWDEAHTDWNDNFLYPTTIDPLMNGFVVAAANDARQYPLGSNGGNPVNDINGYRSMGYFTDADLNYYYYMASNFATSDRWFSPVMTRTQLNRAYIIGATSQGHAYPIPSGGSQFTATPIFEALQNAGITWRIYVNSDNTSCANETGDTLSACLLEGYSYLNQFTYEETILNSAGQTPDLLPNIAPISQFYTDILNDKTLPQVIMIEPASTEGLDEHPSDSDQYPENIQAGAAYAANVINKLMTSPSWSDSALIFTYDEGGGFYDHVQQQPVPVPDQYAYPTDLRVNDACDGANQTSGICSFGMTGSRVPLIVISPFAKKNYVSHVVRDTTAWLNLIEERFNIPALTQRDAYWSTTQSGSNGQTTAQMDEFFDFVNVPWATPPTPPTQTTAGTCSTAAPTP
jgi:phospholipase C